MKFSRDVKWHIFLVSAGTIILGMLMVLVFLICGFFHFDVLLGAIIGCGAVIGNFLLMAYSLHKAADSGKKGKGIAQLSFGVRNLLLLLIAALSIALLHVNPIALIVPYVFPRIVILVMQITGLYKPGENSNDEAGEPDGS